MGGIADAIVGFANRITPKRRQTLVFGWPDHAPNAVATVRAALEHTDLDVVWMVPDPRVDLPLAVEPSDRLRRVAHRSVQGIWAYCRSRYVAYTHGLYGNRPQPSSQTIVQLWHGMPFKKIEALEGRHVSGGADWVVAAGEYWRPILAEAFEVIPDQVAVTGMPRCDLLLADPTEEQTAALRKLLGGATPGRLAIWLPTYRTSVTGDVRSDGTEQGNPLQVPAAAIAVINEVLDAAGITCLVKRHPMSPEYDASPLSAIRFVEDADLEAVSLDLYSLMAMTDLLITDISSVWLDYLVTGKDMLFVLPDMEAYRDSRGLIQDDYESLVPGPVVGNPAAFAEALDDLTIRADHYQALRHQRRLELNEASNGESGRAVLGLFGLD